MYMKPGQYHDWNYLVEIWEMAANKSNKSKRSFGKTDAVSALAEQVMSKVTKKKKPVSRKLKNSVSYDFNRVFSDIASTLTRALSNPLVLLTIALSVGVITTHNFKDKKGFIYDTFNDKNDTISKWIVDNGQKVAGMLIFLPSVVDSPEKFRSVIALTSFLWVMVIPEASVVEYFLQSLAIHTYFKLNNNNSRLTVLAVVGIAWFLGYFHVRQTK